MGSTKKSYQRIEFFINACDESCLDCQISKFVETTSSYLTSSDRDTYWSYSTKCSECAQPANSAYIVRSTMLAQSNVKTEDKIQKECTTTYEEDLEEGKSSGWGIVRVNYQDQLVNKRCSEVIANCTLCADTNQCLFCDDTNLKVNSFKTKRQEDYLYCTSQITYNRLGRDGKPDLGLLLDPATPAACS